IRKLDSLLSLDSARDDLILLCLFAQIIDYIKTILLRKIKRFKLHQTVFVQVAKRRFLLLLFFLKEKENNNSVTYINHDKT
ncbi:hypothetical protein MUP95_02475, partial [bacterium]|nr:hypothetical protein [bacterium]